MIDHSLWAESLAYPLASMSSLSCSLLALSRGADVQSDGAMARLERDFESDIVKSFQYTGRSPEEVHSVRQRAWFGDTDPEFGRKSLETYLHGISTKYLRVDERRGPAAVMLKREHILPIAETSPAEASGFLFWKRLCTKMCPDLMLASIVASSDPSRSLAVSPRIVIPHVFLDRRKFVEQHLHLGACLPFSTLWAEALKYDRIRMASPTSSGLSVCSLDARPFLARAAIARLLIGHYLLGILEGDPTNAGSRLLFSEFKESLYSDNQEWWCGSPGAQSLLGYELMRLPIFWRSAQEDAFSSSEEGITEALDRYLPMIRDHDESMRRSLTVAGRVAWDPLEPLAEGVIEAGDAASIETHLLTLALRYSALFPSDDHFRHLFWGMIRCKNLLYRELVQQEGYPGLGYFSRFYRRGSPFRKILRDEIMGHAEAYLNHDGRMAAFDLRISPAGSVAGQRSHFKRVVREYSRLLAQKGRGCPRIGVVVHFRKEKQSGEPKSGGCTYHEHMRYETYIRTVLSQMRGIAGAITSSPALSQVIRGVDVASIESGIPNWVFAHVFKEFRDRVNSRDLKRRYADFRELGLTAHLGEDFISPISGLRAVHEGLTGFGMTKGDRIGHGVALGIDIEKWIARRPWPGADMQLDQYLDDLAWEWTLYNRHRPRLRPDHSDFIEEEFKRLVEPAYAVCNQCGMHTVDLSLKDWAESYLLRFDTGAMYESGVFAKDADGYPRASVMAGFYRSLSPALAILRAYMCCHRLWEVTAIDCAVRFDADFVRRAKAIQRFVLRLVSERGVTVECCPSSNLFIAGISSFRDHPVFAFANPRSEKKAKVSFTVSSDDPLVFNTSLMDEFAHLYREMLLMGVSEETAVQWIRERCDTARRTIFAVTGRVTSWTKHQSCVQEALEALNAS